MIGTKILDKSESKLDFVFGIDLYMVLSDITLNIARQIVWYNNKILVVTEDLTIGKNENFNVKTISLEYSNDSRVKSVVVPQTQTTI